MSRIGVCAIGLAGLAFGLCGIAQAANAAGNWEQLQQLRPGDKIRVELEGKRGMTGDFAAVTSESLQVVLRKEQRDLPRTEVRRVWVYHASGRSRARAAAPWIGAAAGLGVGIGVGWAAGAPANCTGWCFDFVPSKPASAAILGATGAGLGVLVGYLVSGKSETRTLVYQR